jgi:phage gp36-like protein
MPYITQDDLVPLRLTLADLAELTSETDDVDAGVVQAACVEASGIVDAYCGQRYKTPLQPTVLVKGIATDLALFILAKRRRNTKVSETWSQANDAALKLLRDVAADKASLDQPINVAEPQLSSASVTVSTKPLAFSDDNLQGFC